MQIQLMQEFLVLAETLNFLTAADQLYISQATLSRHINGLEKELGAPLFKRSTRKVELTPFGKLVYPFAQRAVQLQKECDEAVTAYLEHMNNRLVIGCVNHWDSINLAKLTVDFQNAHPDFHATIITGESDELLDMLKKDECQFVLIWEVSDSAADGLSRVLVCETPLFAFLPGDHPLARNETIDLPALKDEGFLIGADGEMSYKLAMQACHDAGFDPRIIYHGGRPQIFNYLKLGVGVSLMFDNPINLLENVGNIVKVPIRPSICANINLVYSRNTLTKVGKVFLSYMKQHGI